MNSPEIIIWLQQWYKNQSNGIWEHSYGISIETIDNPGWKLSIDLKDTILEGINIGIKAEERNENNWVHYKIINDQFVGYGGSENLFELISIFKKIYDRKIMGYL